MTPTYYFRHQFEFEGGEPDGQLLLRIQCDDAAVVYLNGVEQARHKLPEGEIHHDTPATGAAGGKWEKHWWEFDIDAAALREGSNLFAVEIHQKHKLDEGLPSSDVGMDLGLLILRMTGEIFWAVMT